MITFKKNSNNSRLLFTDNDSLMCKIKTKDGYEDITKEGDILDFSNYSDKSQYDDSNKLEVGKIKDETAGAVFKEFGGLKKKMH